MSPLTGRYLVATKKLISNAWCLEKFLGKGPVGDFVGGESRNIGELSCERQVADMVTVQLMSLVHLLPCLELDLEKWQWGADGLQIGRENNFADVCRCLADWGEKIMTLYSAPLPITPSYHPWFTEHLMYKGETVIRTAYHQVWMGVLTIVYFHDTPLPIGNTQLYISSELGDQLLKSLEVHHFLSRCLCSAPKVNISEHQYPGWWTNELS